MIGTSAGRRRSERRCAEDTLQVIRKHLLLQLCDVAQERMSPIYFGFQLEYPGNASTSRTGHYTLPHHDH